MLQMAEPETQPPPADERRELMTLSDAAARCGVDYDTMLRWVVKGVIPHVIVGPFRRKRVYRRDVETLIREGSR